MQSVRELADRKLAENRELRSAMFSMIAGGEAIAFIGAGLSSPLGFLRWPKLLALLATEAGKFCNLEFSAASESDVLLRAEEIQQYFKKHNALKLYKNIIGRETGNSFSRTQRRRWLTTVC